ncbi:MAG: sigma 54-interacting transcriptional regulator, partial [Planctomycetota bacterium]|nr:sigma 54-interacting transcriptional regulator [Planctomycetota bacterium]
DRDREGLLVQAHGGTLFLDELADIPLALQVKLLRCLDQGEVVPVGSNQPVQTDFRIISATHQDLSTLVANGKFRHDLFFRICAFQIDLPPLRERGDDLIQLAKFFIQNLHGHNTETPVPRLSKRAIQAIVSRQWDGNVRELQNAVEHSLILARGVEILEEHLPEPIQTSQPLQVPVESSDLKISLDQLIRTWTENQIKLIKNGKIKTDNLYEEFLACVEPEFLSTVRQHFDNQYLAASKVLGIHRTTLKKKLTDHGIDKE